MSVISRRAFDVRLVETQRGELQWARYRSLNVEWNSTSRGLLFARDGVLLVAYSLRDELMNIVLIAIGCILMALGFADGRQPKRLRLFRRRAPLGSSRRRRGRRARLLDSADSSQIMPGRGEPLCETG